MNINFNQQIKYSCLFFLLLAFSSPLCADKVTVPASIKRIELLVDSSKTLGFSEIENSSGFQMVQNGYSSPNKVFNYWLRIKKARPGAATKMLSGGQWPARCTWFQVHWWERFIGTVSISSTIVIFKVRSQSQKYDHGQVYLSLFSNMIINLTPVFPF